MFRGPPVIMMGLINAVVPLGQPVIRGEYVVERGGRTIA